MLSPKRNESPLHYWISLWPAAPFFGIAWRFEPMLPTGTLDRSGAVVANASAAEAARLVERRVEEAVQVLDATAETVCKEAAPPASDEPVVASAPEAPDAAALAQAPDAAAALQASVSAAALDTPAAVAAPDDLAALAGLTSPASEAAHEHLAVPHPGPGASRRSPKRRS